jgi:hypothetical protein
MGILDIHMFARRSSRMKKLPNWSVDKLAVLACNSEFRLESRISVLGAVVGYVRGEMGDLIGGGGQEEWGSATTIGAVEWQMDGRVAASNRMLQQKSASATNRLGQTQRSDSR